MRLCPECRCRLLPPKYDKNGDMIKRSCYHARDPRCPIAIIDLGLEAIDLIREAAASRRRA